jgi:peptide/nickel transport system substrate-binding protein
MNVEPMPRNLVDLALTRRRLLTNLGLGGLALSAPALVAACTSPTPPAATGQQADLLRMLGYPQTLDYARGGGIVTSSPVTEPILTLDSNLNLIGHLAESWQVTNPTTYVYKIRQGVKYTDGTALTADDIAFAITRHTDPKTESQLAGLIPALKSVTVTAPDEVTVILEEPNATWQYFPTTMLVAPKSLIEELGKDFGGPNKKIIGTGPYKVTSFNESGLEFEVNENYWGQEPPAKKLAFVANISDAQSSLLAMQSNAADGTLAISATVLKSFKEIPDLVVTTKPGVNMAFASFDIEAKPWDDIHVRKAFAYALDRPGLVKALIDDAAQIQNSLIPRSVWGDRLPKDQLDAIYNALTVYDYNLDKARAELAQSAYPTGLTATIWFYSSDYLEKIALTWAQALKQIGVTLNLEVANDELGASREDTHHDLGFHLNDGWAPNYPDGITWAVDLLPSDAATEGLFNEANYKNPAIDELVQKNLASIDPAERTRTLAEVMKIISNDVPYIPLWSRDQSVAFNKRFVYEGYTPFAETNQFWLNHVKPAA